MAARPLLQRERLKQERSKQSGRTCKAHCTAERLRDHQRRDGLARSIRVHQGGRPRKGSTRGNLISGRRRRHNEYNEGHHRKGTARKGILADIKFSNPYSVIIEWTCSKKLYNVAIWQPSAFDRRISHFESRTSYKGGADKVFLHISLQCPTQ